MKSQKLKQIFGKNRIVGLCGTRNCGKTNNIAALIKEFRKTNKETEIYLYGMDQVTMTYLKRFGKVYEISTLQQLAEKKCALICLDEFQDLKLNDHRYKELLNQVVGFIYHNNNWLLLSSPNVRQFNSVIGSIVERWAIKMLDIDHVVNGSQLKKVTLAYNGRYRSLNKIVIPPNQIIIINDEHEQVLSLEYIREIDTKATNQNIFTIRKPILKSAGNSQGIIKKTTKKKTQGIPKEKTQENVSSLVPKILKVREKVPDVSSIATN